MPASKLRLPAVLSVVVLATTAVVTGCDDDDDPPAPDAAVSCTLYCFPETPEDEENCPFPTCAAEDDFACPEGCSVPI